jgi:hypothetical protein
MRGDTVRTIGSAVTIASGIVALSWFGWNLSSRVTRLEEQVHILTAASASPGDKGTAPNSTCQTLAARAAEAYGLGTRNGDSEASNIRYLMKDAGCLPNSN